MPRQLVQTNSWRVLMIDSTDIKCGDLIFVSNAAKESALISHVGLVLEADKIFHVSYQFKKAVIQTNAEFFQIYKQELTFQQLIRFIDPRNTSLREQNHGFFLLE